MYLVVIVVIFDYVSTGFETSNFRIIWSTSWAIHLIFVYLKTRMTHAARQIKPNAMAG